MENPPKNGKAYIVAPKGKFIAPPYVGGNITFKKTYTPGVYQLYRSSRTPNLESDSVPAHLPYGAEPAGSFTVNIDPTESHSTKISNEEINNLLPKANIIFSNGYQKLNLNKTNAGMPLSTYFMMLVGAALLLEGWLVRNE